MSQRSQVSRVTLWCQNQKSLKTLHPPTPNSGKLYNFFGDIKNDVLAHITEPSNGDYDNDGSNNCD